MVESIKELKISAQVAAGTEIVEEWAPPSGSSVYIDVFVGSTPTNTNCVCKLYWKYGTAGQVLLWSIKSDSKAPLTFDLPSGEVDGVNKIAISVENGMAGSGYMSAYARIGYLT
jgi:hypothetical protein